MFQASLTALLNKGISNHITMIYKEWFVDYGTPNTKIFKTHKFYSRSKIYIKHLQNVFNFFLKHIQDIYLLFKIFKIHSRVPVLDMKKLNMKKKIFNMENKILNRL